MKPSMRILHLSWKSMLGAAVVLLALGAGGCNTLEGRLTSAEPDTGGLWSIQVTSSAFKTAKPIPRKYAADGDNVSPPLQWEGVPPQTQELALVVEDPEASGKKPAVHWLVYKIPNTATGLKEGASSGGTDVVLVQGKNSFGKVGYTGPKPPKGQMHHYYFQVYALDERLDLASGVDVFALMDAVHEHVLAKGFLVGTYGHAK